MEIDGGQRPSVTSEERKRIAELERENRELRRANEILKAAANFFARYSDIDKRALCGARDHAELGAFPNSDQHDEVGIIRLAP